MTTYLKVPRDQMSEALKANITTAVTVRLAFSAEDVQDAVSWANSRRYNYDDLGDLLGQWALAGSPGGVGPVIDETSYDFYGAR